MAFFSEWLQWRGRLNRKKYIWRLIKFIIAVLIIELIVAIALGIHTDLIKLAGEKGGRLTPLDLGLTPKIFIFYIASSSLSLFFAPTTIRRWQDANLPTALGVAIIIGNIIVPFLVHGKSAAGLSMVNGIWTFINLIFNAVLIFLRGTRGPNPYGPDPLAPPEAPPEQLP